MSEEEVSVKTTIPKPVFQVIEEICRFCKLDPEHFYRKAILFELAAMLDNIEDVDDYFGRWAKQHYEELSAYFKDLPEGG